MWVGFLVPSTLPPPLPMASKTPWCRPPTFLYAKGIGGSWLPTTLRHFPLPRVRLYSKKMMKSGVFAVVSLLVIVSVESGAGYGRLLEQQTPSSAASATSAAAQKIIQQLVAAQFEKVEAQFDSRMAAALPPGKLAAGWPSLILQAGAFQSITDTQLSKVQSMDVVRMECKFQNAILDATVAFDPDGKIAGLGFRPHQVAVAPSTA